MAAAGCDRSKMAPDRWTAADGRRDERFPGYRRHTLSNATARSRHTEATVDQRVLVERARQGDHDAFAQLVDPALARLDAAARLILRDPELARDAVQETLIRAWRDLPGTSRSRPVRRLAAPPHRERLPRPRPEPATAPDRGRAQRHRLPHGVRSRRAPSPTASWSTRRSGASTPAIARSSRCTTSWGCRCPRWRRPWASRSGRPSPGCITPSRRCAGRRPPIPTRPRRPSREGRSHDRRDPVRPRPARRSSRTCTWGRLPTIETRSWRPPSARGSARPGPSQEGGSPWLTSPAVPRSRRACRGGRIGVALLIIALAAGRGRARRRRSPDQVPPPFGLAAQRPDRLRRRTATSTRSIPRPASRRRSSTGPDDRRRTGVLAGRHAHRVPSATTTSSTAARPRTSSSRAQTAPSPWSSPPSPSRRRRRYRVGAGLHASLLVERTGRLGDLVVRRDDHGAARTRSRRMPSSTSGRSSRPTGPRSCIGRPITGARIVLLDLATSAGDRARRRATTTIQARHAGRRTGRRSSTTPSPTDDPASQRLFIVNADGTGTRRSPTPRAPGSTSMRPGRPTASRSRSRATSRCRTDPGTSGRPASTRCATGKVTEVGPLPRDVRAQRPTPGGQLCLAGRGLLLDWSPDGKSLIAFPGEAHGHAVADQPVDGTWQDPRSALPAEHANARRGSARLPDPAAAHRHENGPPASAGGPFDERGNGG